MFITQLIVAALIHHTTEFSYFVFQSMTLLVLHLFLKCFVSFKIYNFLFVEKNPFIIFTESEIRIDFGINYEAKSLKIDLFTSLCSLTGTLLAI